MYLPDRFLSIAFFRKQFLKNIFFTLFYFLNCFFLYPFLILGMCAHLMLSSLDFNCFFEIKIAFCYPIISKTIAFLHILLLKNLKRGLSIPLWVIVCGGFGVLPLFCYASTIFLKIIT